MSEKDEWDDDADLTDRIICIINQDDVKAFAV